MADTDYQDLVSNYRHFDPKASIIKTLGTFLDEKKVLNKLQQDVDSAGRFGKKKAQKAYDEHFSKVKKIEKDLVKGLNDSYSMLYSEMTDNLQTIAIVAPNNVASIRNLQPPVSFEIKEIISFCKSTLNLYNELLQKLKDDTIATLNENKSLLDRYRKYVDISLSEVEITSKITNEAIGLLNLNGLLEHKDRLKKERTVLEKHRDDVERGLRTDLLNELSILEKDNQTASSLGIQLSSTINDNFLKIRSDFDNAQTLDKLFSAEKLFRETKSEFLNSLRSQITKVRQDVEKQIGKLATVSKETKNFPAPPELDLSSQTSLELIQQIEKIRTYERQVLLAMKRLVDVNDFHASIRHIEQKNISIPRSLKEEAFDTAKKIHNSESITECTELLISYFNISSNLTEIIREKLFDIVNNEALKSIQSLIPPAPNINIESINPNILIKQFEEIDEWSKSVSTYLQGMTTEINTILDQLTRAERHTSLREDFRQDLNLLMNKVMGEKDVTMLIGHRKFLNDVQDAIYNFLFKTVNDELHGPIISKLSLIPGMNNPISFEIKSEGNRIQNLVAKLDEIADWKKRAQAFLKETSIRLLDQTRVMAETSAIFEVKLEPEYYNRIADTKELVKKHNRLEDLYEDYSELEKIREHLNESLRGRIKSLIDLMTQLGMDIVSDIGVSLDGDAPILKESIEKIYRWMENKKSDLYKQIDKSRANLRLFQSKVESGQISYKVSPEFLGIISEKGRPSSAKNDVTELASELKQLSELTIKATEFLSENLRKEVKTFREQISKSRELRSTIAITDPSISEANPGQIDKAISALQSLEDWKVKTQKQLVEGLKDLKFPQIRIESNFDLTNAKLLAIEDIQRANMNQIVNRYNEFLQEMEDMRIKIMEANEELKKQISRVTSRSEELFDQRIEDYTDSRIIDGIDYSYAEIFQEWWNLTSHLAWQKEVLMTFVQNDIGYKLSILQELAPPHDQYFEPTMSFLYEKSQGTKDKDIEEIFSEYGAIQDKILDMIEDDYRKFLQSGILPSIRVALPRIMELVKLPPKVLEIEQNIEKAITNNKDFFAMVSSANQLMASYNEIVQELKSIAKEQSIELIKEVDKLKEFNIDASKYLGKEIIAFSKMDEFGLAFEGEERRQPTIKDTTNCFVAIDKLRSNNVLCSDIRNRAVKYRNEMKSAMDVISSEYGFNVADQVPVIKDYLRGDFERDISRNDLHTLIELYTNLSQIRSDIINLMKDLELQQQNKFEKQLEATNRYYYVIKEIFDSSKSAMEEVFPMATFLSLRENFFNTDNLAEMTNTLPDIRKGRDSWVETIGILSRYHKALIMFIMYFEKSKSEEEGRRQFDEMKKKINSTYRGEKAKRVRMYFTAAIKRFIEVNSNITLDIEIKDELS